MEKRIKPLGQVVQAQLQRKIFSFLEQKNLSTSSYVFCAQETNENVKGFHKDDPKDEDITTDKFINNDYLK